MKLYDTTSPDKIAIRRFLFNLTPLSPHSPPLKRVRKSNTEMQGKIKVRNCDPQDPRDTAAYERLKEGAVFAHLVTRPNYQVGKNLFFAEAGGVIVGYVNVFPEPGIGRVILEYNLDPLDKSEGILRC